jgi:hypothetical protein
MGKYFELPLPLHFAGHQLPVASFTRKIMPVLFIWDLDIRVSTIHQTDQLCTIMAQWPLALQRKYNTVVI